MMANNPSWLCSRDIKTKINLFHIIPNPYHIPEIVHGGEPHQVGCVAEITMSTRCVAASCLVSRPGSPCRAPITLRSDGKKWSNNNYWPLISEHVYCVKL